MEEDEYLDGGRGVTEPLCSRPLPIATPEMINSSSAINTIWIRLIPFPFRTWLTQKSPASPHGSAEMQCGIRFPLDLIFMVYKFFVS